MDGWMEDCQRRCLFCIKLKQPEKHLESAELWQAQTLVERDLNCLTVMEVVQHKNNCS